MSDLVPGWADAFGLTLDSRKTTDAERKRPRKFAGWSQISKASARRGAAKTRKRHSGVPKGKHAQ